MRFLRNFLWLLVLAGLFGLLMGGCESSSDDDDSGGGGNNNDDDEADDDDEAFPFADLEVNWEACDLYDETGDGRAQCARVEMPYDWFNPDERTFTVAAKRLLAAAQPAEAQLWLLHGGPGASGTIGFPYFMESMQAAYPQLDVYTLDPRGTGFSEFAGCPEQQAADSFQGDYINLIEVDACVDYLEGKWGDLGVFGTTNAAIDLAALIEHTKEDGVHTVIWGGSGGTFWGQRYLQLFPEQADGVVFEGNVPPISSLVFQDEYADKATRGIFDLCTDDSFCAGKLPTPEATLRAVFAKLTAENLCYQYGFNETLVKQMIDQMAYYWPYHDMIPALVYRLDRCTEADANALVNLFNSLFGSDGSSGSSKLYDGWTLNQLYFSYVLFFNEVSSELWEYPTFATNAALLAYLDGVYVDTLIGYRKGYDRNDYYLKWARYQDPYDDTWPETETPMLILQGKLDPSTPYDFAIEMRDHYTAPHQTFVEFAYAPHNVTSGTPLGADTDAPHCGDRLFVEFVKDPQAAPDLSCVDQVLPPDFVGETWAPYVFGTPDYWENPDEQSPRALERLELPPRFRPLQRQMARQFFAARAQQTGQ